MAFVARCIWARRPAGYYQRRSQKGWSQWRWWRFPQANHCESVWDTHIQISLIYRSLWQTDTDRHSDLFLTHHTLRTLLSSKPLCACVWEREREREICVSVREICISRKSVCVWGRSLCVCVWSECVCVRVCVIERAMRETTSTQDHTGDGRDVKDVVMKRCYECWGRLAMNVKDVVMNVKDVVMKQKRVRRSLSV